MTMPAGRPGAIILLLATGIIAVLIGVVFLFTASVGAHPCDINTLEAEQHLDFQSTGVRCVLPTHQRTHEHTIEVDGGRDRRLVFKAYVPDNLSNIGDSIVIAFEQSFDLLEPNPSKDLITVEDNDDNPVDLTTAEAAGKELTLNGNFSTVLSAGEYITITIEAGAGIETPETPWGPDTPRVIENLENGKGYPVDIFFVDGGDSSNREPATDENFVIVKNPISSTVPSAAVQVELATSSRELIRSTDEIVVDFSGPSADSGFTIPSSMATSRIQVDYEYDKMKDEYEKRFTPSDVQIQGERVIFSVPRDKDDNTIAFSGDYKITFKSLARIKNPFSAGIKTIKVSSFVSDEVDTIEAVVRRTTTASPQEGPRGTEFTLEGKGYAAGTVTIYYDADTDGKIDPGETLDSVKTVRGAFRVQLTAQGERAVLNDKRELKYTVKAKDSEGEDDNVDFTIRSSMSFEPPAVAPGSQLTIIITDWEVTRGDVVAVQIAGEPAQPAGRDPQTLTDPRFLSDAYYLSDCIHHPDAPRVSGGRITLTVDVPSDIPPGEQTVAVFDHFQLDYRGESIIIEKDEDKKPCTDLGQGEQSGRGGEELTQSFRTDDPIAVTKATVEIEAQTLTLTPSEAARGQKVTITSSGFTRASRGDDHIGSVWIGGKPIVDDFSEFEVGTDGSIAFTVTVPLDIADGPNEVWIRGSDHTLGQATLTVPEATIALDPAQGQRGTDFTVTGNGFIANEVVILTYGPEASPYGNDIVLADAQGSFELTFTVPLTAKIGISHRVRAVADADSEGAAGTIDAEASHLVLGVTITTSPEFVSPGERMTIRGQNLPSFARVGPISIEGIRVLDGSGVATTDENGSFETEVLVPSIEFGDHTLLVQVAEVIVPHIIKVAPPPLSGTPSEVFKYLIRDGILSIVWHYDNATQSWLLFDPWLPAEIFELNDLTEVGSGDIVWINLRESQLFQGSVLPAGWNLISLK